MTPQWQNPQATGRSTHPPVSVSLAGGKAYFRLSEFILPVPENAPGETDTSMLEAKGQC
jgi:hypothetical protein